MPEINHILIFFIVGAFFSPDFSVFNYYFLMNTIGITQMQYSQIATASQVAGLLGAMIYQKWLMECNVRTIIKWSIVLNIVAGFVDYLFIIRVTKEKYGIEDIYFLYGTTIIFGIVSNAISFLPIMALFARIIPKKIEGTMYAFLTGVWNLSNDVICTQLGYYINVKFFNVTGEDLHDFKKL